MVGNIEQELILRVNIGAFVNTLHPKQKVDVVANGLHLTSLKFVNEDAGIMKSITVPLSKNIFMKNKDLHLKFITKDSISPLELGVSTDSRVLGVAIQSISILPRLSI